MSDTSASLDFGVPENLPPSLRFELEGLVLDYQEENLTAKGYQKKRQELLERYATTTHNALVASPRSSMETPRKHRHTRSIASMAGRSSAMDNQSITSSTAFHYKDTSSLYKVTTTHSHNLINDSSPTIISLPVRHTDAGSSDETSLGEFNPMIPLMPRYNNTASKDWDSIPSILRARFQLYERDTAMIKINSKGKELSITWERLYLRAEKVAHELSAGKHKLYKMDKVLLWYDPDESIEFTVCLLGCFIAGMIAVPVSFSTYTLNEIIQIIKSTNSKFILISEQCYTNLDNLYANQSTKLKLTKSEFFSKITFFKTDDLGTYTKAKKAVPTFDIPNVSYIEFTRTPLGRLSGVIMKHKVLAGQFDNMARIIDSRETTTKRKSKIIRNISGKRTPSKHVILNSLDPTRSTGLVFGVLFNIFSGNTLINVHSNVLKMPGFYESLISKYRVNILLNDQLQLKQVVINYLENPEFATSKRAKIDFTHVRHCLTSCTTVDTDVTDMVVHKWLKNLGCMDASQCYTPLLTMLDFGGIFISTRDQLGNLQNFPLHDTKLKLQDELFIDKEMLKLNFIKPSILAMMNSSSSKKDFLRVASFGFPLPDSTVCIVNPDNNTLVPDLTVGELWVSSPSITDEFYQMERVNDFVFQARINYKRMLSILKDEFNNGKQSSEKLSMIMNMCPAETTFTRTKLMGFVHNGKIFILSLIEDMFLQNQLIRLPNWSHTSDVSRAKNRKVQGVDDVITKNSSNEVQSNRILQSFYLQHITENIVRTVDTVSEVAAFELPHNRDEHFLVVVVESTAASSTSMNPGAMNTNKSNYLAMEKKMNLLTEQVYKMLWIFHKIQPFCVIVVAPGSLPRRYCSLEIANSTVERQFSEGNLKSKFVKFQLDNVILDFVPHSWYYNESIFSEHLSNLRHKSVGDSIQLNYRISPTQTWQTSGIDYRHTSTDSRTGKSLSTFKSIIDILEFRVKLQPNDFAFSTGGGSSPNTANVRQSWKSFDMEYVAIVMTCLICNLIIIPLPLLVDSDAEQEVAFLLNVIESYDAKRIFVDSKAHLTLEQNTRISQALKPFKNSIPKTTIISKIKMKGNISVSQFKSIIRSKFGTTASKPDTACMIWINKDRDSFKDLHIVMNHSLLLNQCKVLKETLQLSPSNRIFSIANYTHGLGFLQACLIGIYSGATTSLFNSSSLFSDPKDFLLGIQNLGVKDLYLTPELLYMVMDKADTLLKSQLKQTANPKKEALLKNGSTISAGFMASVQNIMVPFNGRPKFITIEALLAKYPHLGVSPSQVNYVYEHHFNPFVSMRSYLGIPPVDLYLEPISLREGIMNEVDPETIPPAQLEKYVHLQDSGIVPVCTDVSIINPETLEPCYETEIGEIWCCSEATALDHYLSTASTRSKLSNVQQIFNKSSKSKLKKDPFISEQFKAKINNNINNGLTYLRTGDLGFIKTVSRIDSHGNNITLSLLYILGSISETIEVLGLTHFVTDLEMTVRRCHAAINNCILVKTGGLVTCFVECTGKVDMEYSNLTPLIVSALLKNYGIVIDMCTFIKPGSLKKVYRDWYKCRKQILSDWLNKKITIDSQFCVGLGENNSIYLLSDFEKN
ncbi:unnamed protein product [Kluyveromyces dobzhanskii CBS 2104]|uniref:WGS project CCBQ000000000 data, contig 00015 n=1 Tax=Kluyveromyces dobzhanskii CBS 2104 TaxID=1427455 RepID=A0A0A8LB14_9SACH|nr:unnamed protein product [Kluyveromyces dobzhanskii CBS 2104]